MNVITPYNCGSASSTPGSAAACDALYPIGWETEKTIRHILEKGLAGDIHIAGAAREELLWLLPRLFGQYDIKTSLHICVLPWNRQMERPCFTLNNTISSTLPDSSAQYFIHRTNTPSGYLERMTHNISLCLIIADKSSPYALLDFLCYFPYLGDDSFVLFLSESPDTVSGKSFPLYSAPFLRGMPATYSVEYENCVFDIFQKTRASVACIPELLSIALKKSPRACSPFIFEEYYSFLSTLYATELWDQLTPQLKSMPLAPEPNLSAHAHTDDGAIFIIGGEESDAAEQNKKINICFSIDGNYLEPLIGALSSLFHNAAPDDEFNIYILTLDLSPRGIAALKIFGDIYQCEMHVIALSASKLLAIRKDSRLSLHACSKILLPNILPDSVDKVLYLDSDIIVEGSLKNIYDTDINCYFIGGVSDCNDISKLWYIENVHNVFHTKYINCGVLLLNLDKMRASNFIDKAAQYFNKIRDPKHGDELIFNLMFDNEDILEFPLVYNMQYWERSGTNLDGSLAARELDRAKKAVIIHYSGPKKPWQDISIEQACEPLIGKYYSYLRRGRILHSVKLYPLNLCPFASVFILYTAGEKECAAYYKQHLKSGFRDIRIEISEYDDLSALVNRPDLLNKYSVVYIINNELITDEFRELFASLSPTPVYLLQPNLLPMEPVLSFRELRNSNTLNSASKYIEAVDADFWEILLYNNSDTNNITIGKLLNPDDQTPNFDSTSFVKMLTSELDRQFYGEYVMVAPRSAKWAYLVLSALRPDQLDMLHNDGFQPSLIIEYAPGLYQCILLYPKFNGGDDIEELLLRNLKRSYIYFGAAGMELPVFAAGSNPWGDSDGRRIAFPVQIRYASRTICTKTLSLAAQIYNSRTTSLVRTDRETTDKGIEHGVS